MSDCRYLNMGSLIAHPKIAELVGEFIARWSMAETALLMPLLVAMNSSRQEVAAAILSSTNSTEGKINIINRAIDNMVDHSERKVPMKKSLKKLEIICPERNFICHHAWATNSDDGSVVTIDFRKPVGPGRFTVRSENTLQEICNRTVDAAREICFAAGSDWIDEEAVRKLRL